jgi:CDGSH-type Zn-finger protein
MITIKVRENGPYRIDGGETEVRLVDWHGNEYRIETRPFALCRCGASMTRPFCDRTHSKVGFQAAEAARSNPAQGAPGDGRGAVPGSEDKPAPTD